MKKNTTTGNTGAGTIRKRKKSRRYEISCFIQYLSVWMADENIRGDARMG